MEEFLHSQHHKNQYHGTYAVQSLLQSILQSKNKPWQYIDKEAKGQMSE